MLAFSGEKRKKANFIRNLYNLKLQVSALSFN